MRGAWARSAALLMFGVLLLDVLPSGASTEPSLLLAAVAAGVLGAGLWGAGALVRCLPSVVRAVGPAAGVHEHLRALARRGVPRLRDPDAAGHTRSRAPARLLPAV